MLVKTIFNPQDGVAFPVTFDKNSVVRVHRTCNTSIFCYNPSRMAKGATLPFPELAVGKTVSVEAAQQN